MPNAFDPSWYQSGMTDAGGAPAWPQAPMREPIDPNEPYRTMRSFRSAARGQPPMPEGLPPTMAGMATSAVDPFGIPSWAVGKYSPDARDAWRAQYENDPSGQIFGSLAPIPGIGFLKGPVNALGEMGSRMVHAAPHSIMAALGLGGATMLPSEAADSSAHQEQNAKTNFDEPIAQLRAKISAAEAPSKEMTDLGAKIQANEAKLQALNGSRVPRRLSEQTSRANAISSLEKSLDADRARHDGLGKAQAKTLEAYRPQLADLEQKQAGIFKEAREKAARELPMVERQPWMQGLPIAGGLVAMGSAYVPRMRMLNAFNEDVSRLPKLLKDAEKASLNPKPNPKERLALNKLAEFEQSYPGMIDKVQPHGLSKLGYMGQGALVGGPLAAEMSMLPYQIDWSSQGKDTPAYKAAEERFFTPHGWAKTGASTIAGVTGGSLGGGLPTYRAPMNPDLIRMRGALTTAQQMQASRGATGLPGAMQSAVPIPPGSVPWSYLARQKGGSVPQVGGMEDLVKALTEQLRK